MKDPRYLGVYSWRLLTREWQRFVLPFVSLLITGVVLFLVLLLTSAGGALLDNQARELQGGDVVLESATPFSGEKFLAAVNITPQAVAREYTFTATLEAKNGTAPFSIHAVDDAFPLYGEMVLEQSVYRPLAPDEVVIARAGLERLQLAIGDEVTLGTATYRIVDTVVSEPSSLFGGFEIFPHVFMSIAGYERADLAEELLRIEYRYAARIATAPDPEMIEQLRLLEEENPTLDVDIAGQDRRGLQFGLATVSDFLTIVVLITMVLASVNIYASTLYLVTVERKSLAVLRAIGMSRRQVITVLGLSLASVVFFASVLAIGFVVLTFPIITQLAETQLALTLPQPPFVLDGLLTLSILGGISLASFIPAVRQSLFQTPRQVLIGSEETAVGSVRAQQLVGLSMTALLPLVIVAVVLLQSVQNGVIAMLSIIGVYCLVAFVFSLVTYVVYKNRARYSFFIRTIISHKRNDGLFGIVAFTSLFVALAALGTLTLLQASVRGYLTGDLATTVPTAYVIDVQPSQRPVLLAEFPQITLFSNLGARLVRIDDTDIEAELANPDSDIDRELGREFNVTARTDLLESEAIVAGEWSDGRRGEISVDVDFAERAGIEIGSTIDFTIQGFPVSGVVTSFRSTDSRSGLPFFYFVLSPEDIGQFPSVYFGYANYGEKERAELGRFLAAAMPNVSLIETAAVGKVLIELLSLLLILVFVITLPPLIIATLLIVTLIVSTYGIRRRELARLRAIGLSKQHAFTLYIVETSALAVLATIGAYLVSVAATWLINYVSLELATTVWFSWSLVIGMGVIICCVGILARALFIRDTMPLRELLSYE